MAFMGHDEMVSMAADVRLDARGFMDGSGWTVSTGGSKATGGARTQAADPFASVSPALAGVVSNTAAGLGGVLGSPLFLAAAGLVLVLAIRKRKG